MEMAFERFNTLQKIISSHTKNSIPLIRTWGEGVVYRIPCLNCPGPYLGETCQLLNSDISHHYNDVDSSKDHNVLAVHPAPITTPSIMMHSNFAWESNDKKRKMLPKVGFDLGGKFCVRFELRNWCQFHLSQRNFARYSSEIQPFMNWNHGGKSNALLL